MKRNLLIIISLFIFSASGFCQVPQSMNYQAVVRDATGDIIPNQSVGIRFTVHDSSAAGPVVYSETNSATSNQFGLITAAVGSGTPVTGTFSGINWSSANKYLQVEIDAAGGTNYSDMGSSQLLSVPYSLNAGNSYWTASGSDIYNSNTGNVGIGTAPVINRRLQINTDTTAAIGIYVQNSFNGLAAQMGIQMNVGAEGTGSKYGSYTNVIGNATDNSQNFGHFLGMSPWGTGNVFGFYSFLEARGTGIRSGTSNTVYGDETNISAIYGVNNLVFHRGTGDAYGYFADVGNLAGQPGDVFGLNVRADSDGDGDSYILYGNSVGGTNGIEYGVFVEGVSLNFFSGRVGIGIIDPLSALHVVGAENDSTNAAVRIQSGGQHMLLDGNEIDGITSGLYLNNNSSGDVILATGGGRVGVGTTAPASRFAVAHVTGALTGALGITNTTTNSTWHIYSSGAGSLVFGKAGVNLALIDPVTGAYTATSDARLKTNVTELSPVLSSVMNMKPKRYEYIKNNPQHRESIGFIAQDVKKYFPELVYNMTDDATGEDYLTLDYSGFGVVALKAIQEQQKMIEKQNAAMELLKKEIEELKKK